MQFYTDDLGAFLICEQYYRNNKILFYCFCPGKSVIISYLFFRKKNLEI